MAERVTRVIPQLASPAARVDSLASRFLAGLRWSDWGLGLVLTGLGIWLRWSGLAEGLWVDELHTAWTVQGGWPDLIPRATIGNQSPFYFALVKLITDRFGLTADALRSLSLVAGCSLTPLCFAMVCRWTGSRSAAALTGALVAMDPACRFYAVEARPYALLQFVALLLLALTYQRHRAPSRWLRAAWILGSALLIYFHYLAGLFVMGIAAVSLLFDLNTHLQHVRAGKEQATTASHPIARSLADWGMIGLLSLPALLAMAELFPHRHLWRRFVPAAEWLDILTVFRLDLCVAIPALACALSWLVGRMANRPPSTPRVMPGPALGILLTAAYAVPVILAWLATRQEWAPIFLRRYLMPVAIVPMLAAGVLVAYVRPPFARGLVAVVVAGLAGITWLAPPQRPERRELWQEAVRYVNQTDPSAESAAFVGSGLIEAQRLTSATEDAQPPDNSPVDAARLSEYCLFPVTGIYPLLPADRKLIPLPSAVTPQLQPAHWALLATRSGAWFVLRCSSGVAERFAAQLANQAPARGYRLATVAQKHFGGVTVLRVTTQPSDSPTVEPD